MEITTGVVSAGLGGGSFPAFMARPVERTRWPAIVVVQEAFGLNDHIKDVTSRLAREGYLALAPALGKTAEVVVYPGAPHGFFCNERESYRADAAADAWVRLRELFGRHLNG